LFLVNLTLHGIAIYNYYRILCILKERKRFCALLRSHHAVVSMKGKFMTVIVTTREKLKATKNNGENEIWVTGKLADKPKNTQKISTMGKAGLATLTATLGVAAITAPMTGELGLSCALTKGVAMMDIELAAIITASTLGIAMLIALFKDYEEIEYSKGYLKLHKGQTNA